MPWLLVGVIAAALAVAAFLWVLVGPAAAR
jgi:hypothetical protein